jgi:hypothetical protein
VRIARREARTREETLLERVEQLEQRFTSGATAPPPIAAPAPAARPAPVAGGPILARRERKPAAAPTPPATEAPSGANASATEVSTDDSPSPTESVQFALDDVIEAWPETLALLKAPTRAGIQDAQPIALENGIVVFGVPKIRFDAINERFRKEAAAIKDAFATRLGAAPRFMLRAHDFEATDAFRPPAGGVAAAAPTPVANEPEPPPVDDEIVDLDDIDDLEDAPDAPPDSVSRLVSGLGAEIIDERRRS